MTAPVILSSDWDNLCTPRMGVASLTRTAFEGGNLAPLWDDLMAKASDDRAGAGMAMDMSIIAQLRGEKPAGLNIQNDTLAFQRLYASPCNANPPRLRVLALAAVTDIGGNTPMEFLLEGSGIALATYYVVPGEKLPSPMPDHDVAIVVAGDASRDTLADIEKLLPAWPRPILNSPERIRALERDKLYRQLSGIEGLDMPHTARVQRDDMAALAAGSLNLQSVLEDGRYPLIARPAGSHAGFGLEKIDDAKALAEYLTQRPEPEFFLSRFVNYASSSDGFFRKYRLVVVDGRPYACHMAIADEWKVWYLNANMAVSVPNRMEEAMFMHEFDTNFAARHAGALGDLIARVGLDYFTIDCAQTPAGDLLIFEADNTAIVHDMDPPNVYPYKSAQMQKIFQAVQAMLIHRASRIKASAA